jgi:hypothetical protein
MRYMMMVKANEEYEAGMPPRPELSAEIGKYTEEMMKAGVVVMTGGLLPSSTGVRIDVSGRKLTVTDGPFCETKELIGGFAIIQAASKEEAVEHGKRFMQLHLNALGPTYEGQLEIRPLVGP